MEVIIITGTPGAGKSSVAEALSLRLERSAHIQVDFFRKMIRSGYASPHHWNDEVTRQYALARKNAAATTLNIAQAGFTVIIDDIVHQEWVQDWIDNLNGLSPRFVLLQPTLAKAKERNITREIWTVEESIIESLHSSFAQNNTPQSGWIVVDNTYQTIEETVDEIMISLS